MKLRKLLIFICLATISLVVNAGKVVSVSDFGTVANDTGNDLEALRKAAAYCRTHRGTTLLVPAGTYILRDEEAVDIERKAVSGALGRGIEVQWKLFKPDAPFVKGLDFTGARDLHIEASGATFVVEGWMQVLTFTQTKDVTLRGLSITSRRPSATEARVTDCNSSRVRLAFDPALFTHIDSIAQGRTYFFDPLQRHFYYAGSEQMQLVSPGIIDMSMPQDSRQPLPKVGDVCVIRYGGHYRPCIMLKESEDITLRDVTIFSHSGMGVVGHMCRDITVDGLKVVPQPGLVSSTTTDATHFTSCSGQLTIRNSIFKGNGDDCTNIHNYYYSIRPHSSDQRSCEIRIEGADLHALSLDYPSRGDTMIVINNRNMQEQGRYVVRKVNASEAEWCVDITLDRPLRLDDPNAFFMYNYTRFPKVTIENNRVYYQNGRAFLLKARHIEVRGNAISGSTLSAIKLGAEMGWREAGPVEYALIEDNYIYDCGTHAQGNGASCVMVGTEAPEQPDFPNRNIIIRNNVFDTDCATAVLLQDASNVVISNNQTQQTDYVRQHNCRMVEIK
ncbi:MAG: right-handed parallel beta-helix repeat-containing protein [Prevotella sp.]|nr:right-handed parallel beta-helix repeat-containing protein [Prevotella sp.]